jgi:hypothetical protein
MAIWEDFDTEDAMPIAAGLGFPKNPLLGTCLNLPSNVAVEQFGNEATPPVRKGRWEVLSNQDLWG